jgi:hypothetical protein
MPFSFVTLPSRDLDTYRQQSYYNSYHKAWTTHNQISTCIFDLGFSNYNLKLYKFIHHTNKINALSCDSFCFSFNMFLRFNIDIILHIHSIYFITASIITTIFHSHVFIHLTYVYVIPSHFITSTLTIIIFKYISIPLIHNHTCLFIISTKPKYYMNAILVSAAACFFKIY